MPKHVVFLSVPGLRGTDLDQMPNLTALMADGDRNTLVPSFPCVTWPVQANMLTGKLPDEHGVVANGFYWRDQQQSRGPDQQRANTGLRVVNDVPVPWRRL